MPGPFANAMRQEQQFGRYPDYMLTLMLFRNGMEDFHNQGDYGQIYNDFVVNFTVTASCHPMALRFMTMVSDANYPNDISGSNDQPGDGDAARQHAQAGANAVNNGNRALWVCYGYLIGHSFVLLAGQNDPVESFEGW